MNMMILGEFYFAFYPVVSEETDAFNNIITDHIKISMPTIKSGINY